MKKTVKTGLLFFALVTVFIFGRISKKIEIEKNFNSYWINGIGTDLYFIEKSAIFDGVEVDCFGNLVKK